MGFKLRFMFLLFFLLVVTPMFPAYSSETSFRSMLQFDIRTGNNRDITKINTMFPINYHDKTFTFVDLRVRRDDDTVEGNLGYGLRTRTGSSIHGYYGFLDRLETAHDNVFYQATAGYEYMTQQSTFRVNGYFPESGEKVAVPQVPVGGFVRGNRLRIRQAQLMETARPGYDVEYERHTRLGTDKRYDFQVGYFSFNEDGYQKIAGPRVRSQIVYEDANILGTNGELAVGAQYQNSGVGDDSFFATLRFTVPFGSRNNEVKADVQDWEKRRMTQQIRRDIDIKTGNALETSDTVAIDPGANESYGPVLFVDPDGEPGAGTRNNPTNTTDANKRMDKNSIVILTDDGTTAGFQVPSRTLLTGSEAKILAQTNSGETLRVTLGREGRRILRSDGSDIIRLKSGADDIQIQSIRFVGTNNADSSDRAISGEANRNVTLRDFTVEKVGDHAIQLNGTESRRLRNIEIHNATIQETTRDGIRLTKGDKVTVSNIKFKNMIGKDPGGTGSTDPGKVGIRAKNMTDLTVRNISTREVSGGAYIGVTNESVLLENITVNPYTGSEVGSFVSGVFMFEPTGATVRNLKLEPGNLNRGLWMSNWKDNVSVEDVSIQAGGGQNAKLSGAGVMLTGFWLDDDEQLGSLTLDNLNVLNTPVNVRGIWAKNYEGNYDGTRESSGSGHGDDILIKNSYFERTSGYSDDNGAIARFRHTDGLTLKNVTFRRARKVESGPTDKSDGDGVYFHNTRDVTLENVTFQNTFVALNQSIYGFEVRDTIIRGEGNWMNSGLFGWDGSSSPGFLTNASGNIKTDLEPEIFPCDVEQASVTHKNVSVTFNGSKRIQDCKDHEAFETAN